MEQQIDLLKQKTSKAGDIWPTPILTMFLSMLPAKFGRLIQKS
jgi:hypothetical protein